MAGPANRTSEPEIRQRRTDHACLRGRTPGDGRAPAL